MDITILVSKLHRVAGILADARSGHVLNASALMLSDEDGTQLAFTSIGEDDAVFHFDFVPEGKYILAVIFAMDVVREEVPNPPGMFPPFQTKTTPIKSYAGKSRPLIVQNDVTGVVVAVQEVKTRPGP